MKNVILFAIILAIVGLVVGYFMFGKIAGEYISVQRLLGLSSKGILNKAINTVADISARRNKILLCGLAGAGVGVVLGFLGKRR